eukprot:3935925-Rhodomonas_salina.5
MMRASKGAKTQIKGREHYVLFRVTTEEEEAAKPVCEVKEAEGPGSGEQGRQASVVSGGAVEAVTAD